MEGNLVSKLRDFSRLNFLYKLEVIASGGSRQFWWGDDKICYHKLYIISKFRMFVINVLVLAQCLLFIRLMCHLRSDFHGETSRKIEKLNNNSLLYCVRFKRKRTIIELPLCSFLARSQKSVIMGAVSGVWEHCPRPPEARDYGG